MFRARCQDKSFAEAAGRHVSPPRRGLAVARAGRFAPPRPPVLTLISVPLNVRSGSVSVRFIGIDFGRLEWFFRVSLVDRAGVAQLVEHLICNQRVGGSNPFASST